MTKLDYTKMRLGHRTKGSRKIERCPKCGRKGECCRMEIVKGKPFRDFIHVAEIGGWAVWVKDHCAVDGWTD